MAEQNRQSDIEVELERLSNRLEAIRESWTPSGGTGLSGKVKRVLRRAAALLSRRQESLNLDMVNVSYSLATLLKQAANHLRQLHKDLQDLREQIDATGRSTGTQIQQLWDRIDALEKDAHKQLMHRTEFIRLETAIGLEYRDAVRSGDRDWIKRVFARYHELWPKCGGEFEDEDQARRREYVVSLTRPGRILEVGCAEGAIIGELDPKDHFLVGVDISLDRLKAGEPPTIYVNGLAEELPFRDKSFDTVLLPEIVEHVPNPNEVITEAIRVARRDVIFTVPVDFYDPTHLWNFDDDMFQRLIDKFPDLRIETKKAAGPFRVIRANLITNEEKNRSKR